MNAVFWLLSDSHKVPAECQEQISSLEHFACVLTADLYRQNKKVLVLTNGQDDAERIDEWLWQFEADRFVPHNLPGEGPHYGTPVEINWQPTQSRKNCAVNCCEQLVDFLPKLRGINEWHDFVPSDEAGKKLARERYKQLKELGWQVTTNSIPDNIE